MQDTERIASSDDGLSSQCELGAGDNGIVWQAGSCEGKDAPVLSPGLIVTQVEGGGDRVHGAAKIAVFAGFKNRTVLGSNRTIRGAYYYRAYMEL